MKLTHIVLSATVFTATAMNAFSANIYNLATGLDATDTRITTGGEADAHWTVDQAAGGTAAAQATLETSANFYQFWAASGPASDWIARTAAVASNGLGSYTFSRSFDLTGYDLSTVAISGSWAIDDSGTLGLNSNTLASLGNGVWSGLTPFSVATGSAFFNQGINTLTVTIDAGTNDNQFEAVRLKGAVTGDVSAAPEPSTLALMLGVSGIAFAARRKLV
jgi:hypothetical protein